MAARPGQLRDGDDFEHINHVEGILDAVRNRLLDFLLAIQELRPEAVDSDEALQTIPPEQIRQALRTALFD